MGLPQPFQRLDHGSGEGPLWPFSPSYSFGLNNDHTGGLDFVVNICDKATRMNFYAQLPRYRCYLEGEKFFSASFLRLTVSPDPAFTSSLNLMRAAH